MKLNRILLAVALAIFLCGTATAVDLVNPGTIHSGEVFIIHNGETLNLQNFETLTIECGGKLIIESGGNLSESVADCHIHNNGTIENNGRMMVWSFMQNQECGTIENNGYVDLNGNWFYNYGTIENNGYINGNMDFSNRGTIINNGQLEFTSWDNNYGTIENYGELYYIGSVSGNMGIINNYNYLKVNAEMTNGNVGIINNYGTFENIWKIENKGVINNYQNAIFTNDVHGQILGNPVNYLNSIPEFPTLALPMIAVLGLALLFRKR